MEINRNILIALLLVALVFSIGIVVAKGGNSGGKSAKSAVLGQKISALRSGISAATARIKSRVGVLAGRLSNVKVPRILTSSRSIKGIVPSKKR